MTTRRFRHGCIAFLCVVGLGIVAGSAIAQHTGGSMGGGRFGGGSSHSSRSSYGGDHYRYRSGGSRTGSGGCSDGEALAILMVVGVVVARALVRAASNGKKLSYVPSQTPPVDVSVLQVVLDSSARATLQQRLAQIAESCDTGTNAGLVRMLREVSVQLRRVWGSWLYVGAYNAQPMLPSKAEPMFQTLVADARSGFQHELIRNTHGAVVKDAAPGLMARGEEGPGLVLVTVAVAARGHLLDIADLSDSDQVRRALEGFCGLTAQRLVAVEIIWTPAADKDRMSSYELEQLYPKLVKLPHAVAGKTSCAFCGGLFPRELLTCPHCGGRVEEAGA